MNSIHTQFAVRNLHAYQRLLDCSVGQGSSTSTGGAGKSWTRSSSFSPPQCDVNERDWLGRTVLHIACASAEPSVIEYIRLLLAHPAVNVNLPDAESHWTALHRALYHGNISAAYLLLQRSDTDTSLKDIEGYTAFDLYNTTLKGTKPLPGDMGRIELFTWGTNRNPTLGLGDADDRALPDKVVIPRKDDVFGLEDKCLHFRLSPVEVRQVVMSRLHTAIVTSETAGNLRVCGFGNGGRLGPGQHTQYHLKHLTNFTHLIISVALGQDHTLALTKSGGVLSWGLNRFSQLGYVVEHSSSTAATVRLDEHVQPSPRRVFGLLRKEIVQGVAASKCASACWTDKEVFTWGTNNGHLGYDRAAHPVQVLPRKVTKVVQPVVSIAMTDSAMACLLVTQEVVCIWNDRHSKIHFPPHGFPSEIQVYRPPQAIGDAHISKITSCDDTFAAVSSNGEVFIFSVPNPSEADNASSKTSGGIKPQRVWALRKHFSPVKDVALGEDGSIIICTETGHVFVRTRMSRGGVSKTSKFQRVPYIQRVTNVCANNTGAFAALRVDFAPKGIRMVGNSIAQDLAEIQPYLRSPAESDGLRSQTIVSDINLNLRERPPAANLQADEDEEDAVIQRDIQLIRHFYTLVERKDGERKNGDATELVRFAHGADIIIQMPSGLEIPAHRVMLAARAPVFCDLLSGRAGIQDKSSKISLTLVHSQHLPTARSMTRLGCTGCHTISIFILLTYLYCDEVPTIWDRRTAGSLEKEHTNLKVNPNQVKVELQILAEILQLPHLANSLESPVKLAPTPSLINDMAQLFDVAQAQHPGHFEATMNGFNRSPLIPDVILQLSDKNVCCHSFILRARSPFFADFFDDEDWTVNRWGADGTIEINLKHLKERVMFFVLRFLYGDEDIFMTLNFVTSLDELLEFLFDVMAAANELLIDRLVLLCSTVVLKYTSLNNACYILAEATHLHSTQLVESLQDYMAVTMEVLLENHMLDDMPVELIDNLAGFVRKKQAEKSPVSRSDQIVDAAMRNQSDWLALQDFPQPIIHANRHGLHKVSSKLSPSSPGRKLHNRPPAVASLLPHQTISAPPTCPPPSGDDDIFAMDETDTLPTFTLDQVQPDSDIELTSTATPIWKASSVPRVDMKAIMAEAAHNKAGEPRPSIPVPVQRASVLSGGEIALGARSQPGQRTSQRERRKLQRPLILEDPGCQKGAADASSLPVVSPWKLPSSQAMANRADPVEFPPSLATPSRSTPSANLILSKGADSPVVTKVANTASQQVITPRRTHPALGPIISPVRQPSSAAASSTSRTSSGSKAWNLPPVQPDSDPPHVASGVSLIAIQHMQLEQGAASGKDKRSLRDIQEEEQALQVEADFMKWWSAEEGRIKAEEEALAYYHNTHHKKSKNRGSSRGKANNNTAQSFDPSKS